MNSDPKTSGKSIRISPKDSPVHPDRTENCLDLDRIFAAIGLEEEEKKHLETCEFCQRQVKSFRGVSLELRRPGPLNDHDIVISPSRHYPPVIAASVIICVSLAVATTTLLYQKLAALSQAAQCQTKLNALYEVSGVGKALATDCVLIQPDKVLFKAKVDTALVNSLTVTLDSGQTWKTLYSQSPGQTVGMAGPVESLSLEVPFTFDAPPSGTKQIEVQSHVQYIPEVVAAFPEFSEPQKTEQTHLFEMTATGISKLIGDKSQPAVPERLLAVLPLEKDVWELTYSQNAVPVLDSPDGELVYGFKLPNVGDYVNISRSIPGASPSIPFVSLTELSMIEIQLSLQGHSPITAEIKMVDDNGRTTGALRLVHPDNNAQTLRIPKDSLVGYWGIRNFDFNRVRRLELALARKAIDQASEGSLVLDKIQLLGTGKFPELWMPPHLETFEIIPLETTLWSTATSGNNAKISLSGSDGTLLCDLSLRYADDLLPWANLETQLPSQTYADLKALEFEVMWKGPRSITFEPKLVMSDNNITYGKLMLIEPSDQYQTVRVFPQDMKYYWSGSETPDTIKMDLGKLHQLSLGLAAKSPSQAQQGNFLIRTIRFLR